MLYVAIIINSLSISFLHPICTEGKLMRNQLRIEPHSNHFIFAWLAFYPDTEIFKE